MRNIVGHYSASASAAYNDLKILNISLIYEHQCLCSMFKINNNASPTLLIESIKSNQIQHSYNTRRKNYTRTPFCSLSIAQKSFSFQGPVFQNQLPNDMKTLNCTVQTFSKKLRCFCSIESLQFSCFFVTLEIRVHSFFLVHFFMISFFFLNLLIFQF